MSALLLLSMFSFGSVANIDYFYDIKKSFDAIFHAIWIIWEYQIETFFCDENTVFALNWHSFIPFEYVDL